MQAALELAQALIARRSVTPEDDGCQALLAQRLAASGFRAETLRFGEVTNLWARQIGRAHVRTPVTATSRMPSAA